MLQINDAVRLHWHDCDDDFLVFDETSGQTHQLDPVRAFVLNAFSVGPLDFETLLDDLSGALAPNQPANLATTLRDVLHEFESCGLIEATAQ